jgi:hypothetical protein
MMKTLQMIVPVNPDRTVMIRLPEGVAPGAAEVHLVVVVEDAQEIAPRKREPLQFSSYDVGIVDPNFTYRREDLYGDGDR